MSREAAVHSRDIDTTYRILLPALETFYGRRFEKVCREYLEGTSSVERIGSWSGKIPVMKYGKIVKDESGEVMTEDADVDIVADCREGNMVVTVFDECKFTARRCGTDVIEELIRRSHRVSKDKNRRYYVFSRSGFMPEAVEMAESGIEDIVLVDIEDIRRWAEEKVRWQKRLSESILCFPDDGENVAKRIV